MFLSYSKKCWNYKPDGYSRFFGHAFIFFLSAFLMAICAAFPSFAQQSGFIDLMPQISNHKIQSANNEILFGLFIGVMITASLYLFFIWIVIRDKGQVFLMLLLLCFCVNMISTNESLMLQMGLGSGGMKNLLKNYSMILSYFLSIFFTLYFLEIDDTLPALKFPLSVVAGILLLLLAWTAFDQNMALMALPIIGVVALGFVLAAGVGTMRIGVSGSLIHTVAFLFFFIGSIVEPMYNIGYINDFDGSKNLSYMSFSLAAMMFAIVIAGQFAARQEEKERELAISNERFALAARGSNEGLFDWNLITGEVYFSKLFKKILGVEIENNTDGLKAWVRMIMRSDRLIVMAALRKFRSIRQSSTIIFEYRVEQGDGEQRWIHTKTVATRSARTGRVTRYVGSIGDVTARKRGEAELKASETRFRSITEAHPVPVMIVSLHNQRVLYASPGAERLLGLPQGTITSHMLGRFIVKASEREEIIGEMIQGNEINLKEVGITKGDGNLLSAALSARKINYQNQAAMVLGIYDLTEKKHAEAQIAKQQEALQQSEKMAALGGLLAGVAHELNNPLSVVVGQATLLTEGSQEPTVKTRAEKIFKAADRCSRIVKSFLALARKKPPERKPLDINNIINSSLELLSYQFKTENVTLKMDLNPNVPLINGDGDQLTQVFTNLALNAAQAMHDWKGEKNIKISTYTEKETEGFITVKITDTGPGIPDEIKKRVFEPFFTTKGNKGGTGVGLALCLNIIETHGGHLRLEDNAGGGAVFLIMLPIAKETENQVEQEGKADDFKLPELSILIVDDELELAQTLADLLEPEGHKIDMAANGSIALKKMQKTSYDAIISDLRMPVMDGPELYSQIAENMPVYIKKIAYVTGDTLSPHVQEFLGKTPVPVIEKPYRLADIRKTLAGLLRNKENCNNADSGDKSPVK